MQAGVFEQKVGGLDAYEQSAKKQSWSMLEVRTPFSVPFV